MSRHTVQLRSWALITISFVLGMMASEFIDLQWQSSVDATSSLVASQAAPDDTQR